MSELEEIVILIRADVRAKLRRYGYEDAGRIAAMVDALLREALGMHGGGEGKRGAWDDDPVLGPMIREAYDDLPNIPSDCSQSESGGDA